MTVAELIEKLSQEFDQDAEVEFVRGIGEVSITLQHEWTPDEEEEGGDVDAEHRHKLYEQHAKGDGNA